MTPKGLSARGRQLWAALASTPGLPAAHLVLLEEACRAADRLDRLDAILRGEVETWARLVHSTLTEDYELRIDGAMAEARQQQNTLRLLLAAIAPPAAVQVPSPAGGGHDELARIRAARTAGGAGSEGS